MIKELKARIVDLEAERINLPLLWRQWLLSRFEHMLGDPALNPAICKLVGRDTRKDHAA